MLIILEGPDLAGKTTLAEQLKVILEASRPGDTVHLLHKGPPKRHVLEEYENDLLWYTPGSNEHVICDRWHLGELIYGPMMRGKSELTLPMFTHVTLFLQSIGALVVHVDDDNAVLLERYDERGESYIPRDRFESVVGAYRAFESRYRKMHMCVAPRIQPGIEHYIILGAMKLEESVLPLRDVSPSYIGGAAPDFLLVGDKSSIPPGRQSHRSAFVPYLNTSGHHLFESVYVLAMIDQDDIGVINANEPTDPNRSMMRSWSALGEPLVLALGREASKTLTAEGVKHGTVPHPQFMRRFHNRKVLEYYDAIAEAMIRQEDFTHLFIKE